LIDRALQTWLVTKRRRRVCSIGRCSEHPGVFGIPSSRFLLRRQCHCRNRYLAGKQEEKRGPKQKRPYLASECRDLNEADKWRQQILREIGKKVMEIQNAGLGEHRYLIFPLPTACQHIVSTSAASSPLSILMATGFET
jgi:hypothetical protein